MLTQPIRSVITTMTIAACICGQFASEVAAQQASSRRAVKQPAMVPMSEGLNKPVGNAVSALDSAQTSSLVQSNEANRFTESGLARASSRRTPAKPSPVSAIKIARTSPMQPSASVLPAAFIADQVPVPSLEDPEMFRVPAGDSITQDESNLADKLPPSSGFSQFPAPKGPYSSLPIRQKTTAIRTATPLGYGNFALPRQQTQLSEGVNEDAGTLLDQLPDANLHQGLAFDSMSQANAQGTVGDPYMASRAYAGQQRVGAGSITKTWRSPNMRHRPLYFEQPNLERYGHTHPRLQPLLSGAHFFSSVALLPYKTGVNPPSQCLYSIGHGRPGDCVEKVGEKHPFNPRAALRQAAVVVTGIAGL